jgi:hypothetical protein
MQILFDRILTLLVPEEQIRLRNGNFYSYLGPTSTRINGERFPLAFEYEISAQNHKKVTVELIHTMYQLHLQTGIMQSRSEIFDLFPRELCSRPCNYTAAVYIVQKLINDDFNQNNT